MFLLRRSTRTLAGRWKHTATAAVARSKDAAYGIETIQLRELKADEVLVRVVASGICHTDIVHKNMAFGPFPSVLGHEGAGVVEQVGAAVTAVAEGDHVVMSYGSCGTCPSCLAGLPPYCNDHGEINFAGTSAATDAQGEAVHTSFFQQSSFATRALATQNNVVKVDKDLDLNTLAPLGCGIQTGAGAVLNSLQARPGSSVGIFGCGAVGLSAVMAAKLAGCSRVVAMDINESRLELAKELGATHTINMAQDADAAKEQLRENTIGGLGLDHALDTTGNKGVIRTAVESLAHRGVCAFVAPGQPLELDSMSLLNGKSLRGVIQGDSVAQTFIPHLIEQWRQGNFPFDKLITYYEGGLEDLNTAISDTTAKDSAVIKPVLKISRQ